MDIYRTVRGSTSPSDSLIETQYLLIKLLFDHTVAQLMTSSLVDTYMRR